jgi:hypothetical protein
MKKITAGLTATYTTVNASADTRKLRLVHKGEINIVIDKTEALNVVQEKFAR